MCLGHTLFIHWSVPYGTDKGLGKDGKFKDSDRIGLGITRRWAVVHGGAVMGYRAMWHGV